MIVKVGKPKHFDGDEGVYYQPDSDEVWLLENKELAMTFDGRCLRSYTKYRVSNRAYNNATFVVVGSSDLIKIGEL